MSETQIVQMLIAGQNDLSWFESNLDSLKNTYNNKFIAFKSQEILEFDDDLNRLMDKLKKDNIDTSNVLVRFVSKVKTIL